MSRSDDQVCLSLGREVVRMINDVRAVSGNDTGYARRKITFPGGAINLFVAKDDALADVFEKAARRAYEVADATPPSQVQ